MKSFKLFVLSFLMLSFAQAGLAQEKKEAFKVGGECGMCKKKIETAAKKGGATYAAWNADTKELVVKYDSKKTTAATIQQNIAGAGYDTPAFKATDDAYSKLDDCCKYERTTAATTAACCAQEDCCKDGKCTAAADTEKSCCADGKCTKHEGAAAKGEAAACCKKG